MRRRLPGLALALAVAGPAAGQPASDLDALFDAPPFDGMHVGALVVDVETGETIYARRPAGRFVPASNQKVLTTVGALERLGPDYRFRTTIEAVGEMGSTEILVGDLVVRGSGDPTLSARYHDDAEQPLEALADRILETGLRRVRGDLVIDAAAWDSTRVEATWMWGDLPYGYAAVGGPFVLAEGRAEVEARAGAPGEPVTLRWWPVGDPGRFSSSARSVPPSDSADLSARLIDGRR
ncbi:MAG: D-alanyl-D-alanine carboxypeptidase, partial [Longimicrobiales bacterium]